MTKKSRVNECGHPERKHQAKGMCNTCYTKWKCEDPEYRYKLLEYKKQYYKDHKEELLKGMKQKRNTPEGKKARKEYEDSLRDSGYYRTEEYKESARLRKHKYRSEGKGKQTDKEYKSSGKYKKYLKDPRTKSMKRSRHRVRKALKLQASIGDGEFNPQVAAIYLNCPKGFHVDHIIPLNNSNICGLHVPWNLQYLNETDNLTKGSKFDGTYDNNSWRGPLRPDYQG